MEHNSFPSVTNDAPLIAPEGESISFCLFVFGILVSVTYFFFFLRKGTCGSL